MPQRIQRKRTKGWRMPAGAVYVGRPSVFGNITSCSWPYGCPHSPDFERHVWEDENGAVHPYRCCVDAYRHLLDSGLTGGGTYTGKISFALEAAAGYPTRTAILERLPELRGRDLACWCSLDKPCHADVLLDLANREGG
ncbi:DUF4326 domain-containing protein [Fodinicurvata fenggangensis]|uniref:DUF4326 domain-containing protein n=1 Tax=Fodinicurvata fenggangensis TaxID=1121830 RepID=UPI00047A1765|nr:DUF4326 domain-containing protein [Fodinicurvata fenggangensis]